MTNSFLLDFPSFSQIFPSFWEKFGKKRGKNTIFHPFETVTISYFLDFPKKGPFFPKNRGFFGKCWENDCAAPSPFLPLHRQNKEVWVSGLNQHTANVPNRKVPKVRILLLPHIGSLAQLDQSTTLRTSVSGVRVSHESQHWRFGRLGVCAGLKIPRTWFDSTRLHFKIRECSSGNEGGL